MESILLTALSAVLGFISSFLVNVLLIKYKQDKKKEEQEKVDEKLLRDADRHLLRRALKEDHDFYMHQGYCSVEDKDEVEHTYQTYHGLGGNGLGTSLRNDIMALPDYPLNNK